MNRLLNSKYSNAFKNAPVSHLISFTILHEITAIVPLPIVYYTLSSMNIEIPFSTEWMQEGNKRMTGMLQYFNKDIQIEPESRTMLNLVTSYLVVKALMPVRVTACFWMTPWFASRVVIPFNRLFFKS